MRCQARTGAFEADFAVRDLSAKQGLSFRVQGFQESLSAPKR
jgi:hypothetical protein